MSILNVIGVQKIYTSRFGGNKVEALKSVYFTVEQGEYVAIMGESGSGKTTLLNILAALNKPTSGSVSLDGKDLSRIKESQVAAFRRDNLGFVFQEFNLLVYVFSLIFMFYSNLFLIRQRNKEFGLYNVLGMDKGNLGMIMLWENLIVLGISTSVGLIFGIALLKLTELGMVNLLKEEISYTMRIDFASLLKTLLLFIGIYFLLFLNSFIKVRRSNPRELLNSRHSGEKPPKANWVLSIMGMVILGVAYYIALSIKQPLTVYTSIYYSSCYGYNFHLSSVHFRLSK